MNITRTQASYAIQLIDCSFSSLECDKSCKGCDGDGPDMCFECANGYIYDEEKKLCLGELLN